MSNDTRKEKSYSAKSPTRHWDYIVIGSGIGGMTSAALLAKAGRKVLVLEQHSVPGGFTHVFQRKPWTWDVGVHVVGEVTHHALPGRILHLLTDGRLQWEALGGAYDKFFFPDGFRIDFPDKPDQFIENLCRAFPDEEEAIHKYMGLVNAAVSAMQGYYAARTFPSWLYGVAGGAVSRKAQPFIDKTTKEVLDELTDNDRLKSVLAAQWGYYGSPPSRSSFAIHAMVVKHFQYGGFYPVGGSAVIARELGATVAKAGGWTRVRAEVDKILLDGNRAVGVVLEGGEEIRGSRIISAAGANLTVRRLLRDLSPVPDWAASITRIAPSPPHICLHLGFKGDIAKAGATRASQWFYETWDHETGPWDLHDPSAHAPALFASFPSLKDPRHDPGPENIHTGEVITFVDYDAFAKWTGTRWKKRGEEYEAFKKDLGERMLARFLDNMPGLRPMVAYQELSTPLSTEHFVRSQRGAVYGLEATPDRFNTKALRAKTPVKNLFLSGSDVSSMGVIGAMIGGVLAALAAEPLKMLTLLRSAYRR